MKTIKYIILAVLISTVAVGAAETKPNVLFIAIDHLNHGSPPLKRNPKAKPPNMDSLAGGVVTFPGAYPAVPACEPSRAALMGGRRPWVSSCYKNGDKWKNHVKPGESLSAQFLKEGYYVAGAGKIYHSMQYHEEDWTEYMPDPGVDKEGSGVTKYDGFFNRKQFPDLKDEDLYDWHTTSYCVERLKKKHDKPFFIACGLYKPHLAFVVPRKYYKDFPLDEIKLPPYKIDDLDDIPPSGQAMARQVDQKIMLENDTWEVAIQSYLATCAYTDKNVGRLLNALEEGPNKDNTIIVLWTDHGWSFGEKNHWRKFALWEEPTRVVYIWSAPGVTPSNARCDTPVDLQSVYPTLCSLTGITKPEHVEGLDITPLLKDPESEWSHPAITTHGFKNHAVRKDKWRLIQYANGEQELYDHSKDPYEWTNLA
ncbi:iduronate-2-sulfatase, partial [bacterium E08(2017)]